jgi:hypothetical protein
MATLRARDGESTRSAAASAPREKPDGEKRYESGHARTTPLDKGRSSYRNSTCEEKRPDVYLAILHLAFALITWRAADRGGQTD